MAEDGDAEPDAPQRRVWDRETLAREVWVIPVRQLATKYGAATGRRSQPGGACSLLKPLLPEVRQRCEVSFSVWNEIEFFVEATNKDGKA